jgi:hypothetical protein
MNAQPPKWLTDLYKNKEQLSNVVTVLLVGLAALLLWKITAPDLPTSQKPPKTVCPRAGMASVTGAKQKADSVANSKNTLTIYIGRYGISQNRESNPLTIQSGQVHLAAGTHLCTANSDFVRSDGTTLPAFQVTKP